MKRLTVAALLTLSLAGTAAQAQTLSTEPKQNQKFMGESIHQFTATALDGSTFDFATLRGKKVIVVNTASECGFTPQYKELQMLSEKYKDKLVIIGFPTNDFGGQEPGSNKEIATFCEKNYGVTFPMMAKITVKGKKIDPVYQFLTQKDRNGVLQSEVEWNFQKYLIDEQGHLVKMLPSKIKPDDAQIIQWLKS